MGGERETIFVQKKKFMDLEKKGGIVEVVEVIGVGLSLSVVSRLEVESIKAEQRERYKRKK